MPFLLQLYARFLGDNSKPLQPRITSEIQNHLGFLSNVLGKNEYFYRNKFSGVDIMLSFVLEAAKMSGVLQSFSNLNDLLAKYQDRDAYKKAIELGGKYTLGK
jgi:glutathione S-transferase